MESIAALARISPPSPSVTLGLDPRALYLTDPRRADAARLWDEIVE